MPAVLNATREFRHHNITMYSMKNEIFILWFGTLCYVWVYQKAVSGSICWASGHHCHVDNSPNVTVWNMGETERGFPEIPLQSMSDVSVQMACGPLCLYAPHYLHRPLAGDRKTHCSDGDRRAQGNLGKTYMLFTFFSHANVLLSKQADAFPLVSVKAIISRFMVDWYCISWVSCVADRFGKTSCMLIVGRTQGLYF